MNGHPVRARVADVVAEGPGADGRGSGYLVADGWVLTAQHVVADAVKVAVWLGAPPRLGPDDRRDVDLTSAFLDEGSDLVLLPVTPGAESPVEPALLGRLDRDAGAPVPVVAAGCPRFKLRPGPTRGKRLRELHEAHGTVAARSNTKTGTYEMADLAVVPDEDPEPDLHSPWEGMSGAAVWADQRLVGVVARHHPGEGRGTLTVRPLEELLRGSADRSARWREVLGPRLPNRPGGLWLVRRAAPGEAAIDLAREVATQLLPSELQERDAVLEERDAVLADLDLRLASDERWCWVQGEAFAGKTALLAWLVTHPPPEVALASCFLRSTTGANTADYALSTLTGQLAALADRVDYQPARFPPEKRAQFRELLPEAARACRERGHRLVLLIDGLDEYDRRDGPLRELLVGDDDLPAGAALLVASRSGVDLDLPAGHPLHAHALPLAPTQKTDERRALAVEELDRALADQSRLEYAVVGLVAAADGGLTPADLRALLRRMGISAFVAEITDALGASLRRTVTAVPDPVGRAVYAFTHRALEDAARAMFAEDLAEFAEALLGWCDGYRDAGWPEDTPDYVLSHYPGHLHAAGRPDDLVALLQDRAWYRRHEASDPSGVAYLAGVQTAWQAAEQLDAVELRAGRPPKVLGAEMRACLTAASLASLSGAITPELIGALVATGAWAPRRAFQVAQMAPLAQERARLLVALAGEVGDDIREEVVSAAMAATNGIVEDWGRAHAWIDLAPHIPEALLDDALRFAENLPSRWGQFGERLRAWAVSSLLARAATLCLEDRVLNTIRAMGNARDRALTLREVVGVLPAERTDEVLSLIRDLGEETDLGPFDPSPRPRQARVLASLPAVTLQSRADIQALTQDLSEAALDALQSASAQRRKIGHIKTVRIDDEEGVSAQRDKSEAIRRLKQGVIESCDVLEALACTLPARAVEPALIAARSSRELSDTNPYELIKALAKRLAVLGEWSAALEIARSEKLRLSCTLAIAPYAPASQRAPLGEEMLDLVRRGADSGDLSLPPKMGPYLTEPALRRALGWLDSLEPATGTKAARLLLPRLAELGHAQEAFDRALDGQELGRSADFAPGVNVWADLIPLLPQPLRGRACDEALRLASGIDDRYTRLLACAAYVGALDEEEGADLLRSLPSLDNFDHAKVLRELLPNIPERLLPDAVEVALTAEATRDYKGKTFESPRVLALIELAPRLTGPLRERALEASLAAISQIGEPEVRHEATLRVAAAFSAPLVATPIAREAVTQRLQHEWGPVARELILAVAAFLPTDMVNEVRRQRQSDDADHAAVVKGIVKRAETDSWRASPFFSAHDAAIHDLHLALYSASSISAPELRATALGHLAPYSKLLLERGSGAYQSWDDWAEHVSKALKAVGPQLSHDQLPDAVTATIDLIRGRGSLWSPSALDSLSKPLAKLPHDQLHRHWQQILHALAPRPRWEALRHLRSLAPVITALGGQTAAREFVRTARETAEWWP